MFTVNHHDMVFGLECLVAERRQAAQPMLDRDVCANDPAAMTRRDRPLAGAGNWLAVQGRRLGAAKKPLATPHTGTR